MTSHCTNRVTTKKKGGANDADSSILNTYKELESTRNIDPQSLKHQQRQWDEMCLVSYALCVKRHQMEATPYTAGQLAHYPYI